MDDTGSFLADQKHGAKKWEPVLRQSHATPRDSADVPRPSERIALKRAAYPACQISSWNEQEKFSCC